MGTDQLMVATTKLHQNVLPVLDQIGGSPKVHDSLLKAIQEVINDFNSQVKEYVGFMLPASRWITVMLVSFLEAYLEEGLAIIAARNPSLDIGRVFEIESIDELRNEIRLNWAQTELKGGPKKWVRKLCNFGAPPFDDENVKKMQHMWDTRNIIVHSNCLATAAYAREYFTLGIGVGRPMTVNMHMLEYWLKSLGPFIKWSDSFFFCYGGNRTAIPE